MRNRVVSSSQLEAVHDSQVPEHHVGLFISSSKDKSDATSVKIDFAAEFILPGGGN